MPIAAAGTEIADFLDGNGSISFMPVTTRDGASLYWEKHGQGPALILGAGLGGVGAYWAPNLARLTAHFTVYLFDQRGTGRSSREPVHSIEQMSADLIAVMEDAGLARAMYLGHSTGGAIGVATALDHPDRITSMMIYASTTCGDAYRRKVLGLRSKLFSGLGLKPRRLISWGIPMSKPAASKQS
jgi:aminoacrylate hydrolase